MWSLLFLCFTYIEPVVLQEKSRLILKGGSGPCDGYIQVYHDNRWGYVGDKGFGQKEEEVVCRTIGCGRRIGSENIWLPPDSLVWLNEVNCTGTEKDLWSCGGPGWTISDARSVTVKKITCSNQIRISLEEFNCSGSVMYSIDGTTPSGYFCGDEWGDEESSLVCSTLGCGEPAAPLQYQISDNVKNKNMKMAKCVGNVTHLWQCVTGEKSCQKPASVTCDDHEIMRLKGNSSNVCSGQLEIKKNDKWTQDINDAKTKDPNSLCKKMFCGDSGSMVTDGNVTNLTCSNKVSVVLRDRNENKKCYGSVHIQVNDKFHPVCALKNSWTKENAEVVCREQNCGELVSTDRREASIGIMDFVSCTGDETSLWHCKATRRGNNQPFSCSSQPTVVCSDSVKVRLKDGPGRCAGRVEIFYDGEYRKVPIKKGAEFSDNSAKTVCKQLGCGDVWSKTEKFSKAKETKAMARIVSCDTEGDNIAKCIKQETTEGRSEDDEVGLVCEDHRVFVLDGDSSCSGLVGVQHRHGKYWFSGSDETWSKTSADTVCEKMHCGKATDFSKVSIDSINSTWHPDPSCSSESNPLLDCGKVSSESTTVARVQCSGNKKVSLTNKCWGNVNICVKDGTECGGVCADSWTEEKSKKLCQELGCGSQVLSPIKPVKNFKVKFKSVHMTEAGSNLSKCSFVENNSPCESAYVVCSGSLKPQLKSNDYCSGKVEVNYENEWRPVCENALQDSSTQSLFCNKLGCGDAVDFFDYKRKEPNAISTLTCENQTPHENLIECTASAKKDSCSYHGLECSKWRKMALVTGGACSGIVVVYSEGKKRSAVSYHGWSKEEGQKLCKDLNCGSLADWRSDDSVKGSEFWNTTFNCTGVGKEENIWACEKQVPPSQKQLLYVKCSDEPKVELENGCHGNLTIDGVKVCSTSWDNTYSARVCDDLNFSNAIPSNLNNLRPVEGKSYLHVRCEKHHHKIGQCHRFMEPCSDNLVSVYCTKNVKFTTTEKCGGQINVSYESENEGKVCYDKELSPDYKKRFCEQLKGCGKPIDNPTKTKPDTSPEDLKKWNTVLMCTGNEKDFKYCLSRQSCSKKRLAEIYCEGYKIIVSPKVVSGKVDVLAIVLGVGLCLILAIVIFVFVRVYMSRQNRSVKNFLPGFALRNDVEFDSGEFEEIPSKDTDNMRSGGVRSESELVPENDARSTSSLPYDDIDEVSEVQPLTSRPLTTDDPQDSGIQDNKLEQNAKEDGVTYEVEDPRENYDDIEAELEPTQTTVVVHDSPRNAPECSTNAPPDLVLGDDDYLVPGQDE